MKRWLCPLLCNAWSSGPQITLPPTFRERLGHYMLGCVAFEFETGEGGPPNTSWPWRSLYVGVGVLGDPFPSQAPNTHKLHMQVLGRLYSGRQQWSATMVFLRSDNHYPPLWCGRHFPVMGQRVKVMTLLNWLHR